MLSTNMKIAFSALSLILLWITYTNWPTVKSAGTRYLQFSRFRSLTHLHPILIYQPNHNPLNSKTIYKFICVLRIYKGINKRKVIVIQTFSCWYWDHHFFLPSQQSPYKKKMDNICFSFRSHIFRLSL